MRTALRLTVCLISAGAMEAPGTAAAAPPPSHPQTPVMRGTEQQIFEAWLATDVAAVGTYRGVDSTLGTRYHVADIERVWAGGATKGRLVFKAPRGVRAQRGDHALFFLWDRLAAATDSYLEESKSRYRDNVWATIGPDSTSNYLLPFAAYAYKLDGDKLVLRGQSAFNSTLDLDDIEQSLKGWEADFAPARLYARSAVALRAAVERVELAARTENGIVVERRITVTLRHVQLLKGDAPNPLVVAFVSLPRSPRFKQGDEVVAFLSRGPDGPYFEFGKRGVFHVVHGDVLETGQPVAAFVASLVPKR